MKILHVVHAYPPSQGGSQMLTARLSENLVARYGDEVTVFTTVGDDLTYFWGKRVPILPAGTERINGVTVRRFPVFNRLSTLRWFLSGVAWRLRLPYNDRLRTLEMGPIVPGLRRAIVQSQAQVIFATAFPLLHMYDALAGAKAAGIPLVLLGALHLEDRWGYQRPMIYQAIRQADAYIAHTTYERDFLVNQQQIAPDKITIIGGGVDAAAGPPLDQASARALWGWREEPILLAMGKHVARKRYDLLLGALRLVWPRYPQARLVIAGGRTAYTTQLEALVADLPPALRSNVTILTDFPEAQKAALLAACDLFVLASGHESFGLAFAEAWAAGKAVIGARSGAIPAVIDAGRDGLLFTYPDASSLGQAILALLDDPVQRQQLGEAGAQKVQAQFTWAQVTAQVRAVYERVVK
jgi:glycosyltransferase involved in cell wall biosynthesis